MRFLMMLEVGSRSEPALPRKLNTPEVAAFIGICWSASLSLAANGGTYSIAGRDNEWEFR